VPSVSKCPVCRIELGIFSSGNHKTLQCNVCKGVFLTKNQMYNQFKENSVFFDIALPASKSKGQCPVDGKRLIRKCVSEDKDTVQVEQCPKCMGVWFNSGDILEANTILRRRSGTRAARLQAEMTIERAEHDSHTYNKSPRIIDPTWWFSVITHLPIEGYNRLFRTPVVTISLMAIYVSLYALGFFLPSWQDGLSLSSTTVYDKPYQLISNQFIHAGAIHLMGNLYFLKVFGDNVEDRLGRPVFLAFFLLTGIFAGICFINFSQPGASVLGASGAISGILGAYVIFFPKVKVFIFPNFFKDLRLMKFNVASYIPIWFLWQLIMSSFLSGSIAWSAHIGGLVAGMTMAIYLRILIPDARIEYLEGIHKHRHSLQP